MQFHPPGLGELASEFIYPGFDGHMHVSSLLTTSEVLLTIASENLSKLRQKNLTSSRIKPLSVFESWTFFCRKTRSASSFG